ncbi:MAG: hypothetical protein Ct9H90mP27_2870 [Gammaproteobacteria bacterium]|nr:MAG: hypothetical protein Ct9H90mP27_2870 [Gammaproteobacteria bacterium]
MLIRVTKKKGKDTLKERISLSGMGDFFDEVLVPTEEVLEMRAGQKKGKMSANFSQGMFWCIWS